METITSARSNQFKDVAIPAFRNRFSGKVLEPGGTGYDEARKVWNGMINRRPALIVQCESVNDVIESVKFATANNLVVSIRGGGHNVTGNAVCDDGIMIDLSCMRKVQVDPNQRIAVAQTGATWGDFDKATQAFGLATTGGLISATGIAGLTLGGGVGWLVRKLGLTCDNVISAEMVTAVGELVVANEVENPELFWGLRGGGGNFGVVTSLTYKLHPVSTVLGGMILHPISDAKKVIQFYREFMMTAPEELTLYTSILHTPDGAQVIGFAGCYSGDMPAGEKVLQPLRDFGSPLVDLFQQQPYLQIQTMLDAAFAHGDRYYWKSGFLETLSDDAIETIITNALKVSSPMTAIVLEYYGGASTREPGGGTAYPHRLAQFDLVIISHWVNPEEDEKHIEWTRSFWNGMAAFASKRVYVNALGVEGEERVREAYGENYERLLALKKQYDHRNVFCMNQNINPVS